MSVTQMSDDDSLKIIGSWQSEISIKAGPDASAPEVALFYNAFANGSVSHYYGE